MQSIYTTRRREAGRCTKCGDEPAPGRVMCEACATKTRASIAERRARHPERTLPIEQAWEKAHRQQRNAAARSKRAEDPVAAREHEARQRSRARERNPHFNRDYARIVRRELIEAYGGRCECCGETTFEFLALDHIYRDGARERRENGGSFGLFLKLRREGWPRGRHRLLCHNCNMASAYHGGCPHQRQRPQLKVV